MELLIIGALGALLIRVGFAIQSAGMARSKNSAGAVMRQLCDFCVAILAFWAIGFVILDSQNAFFGLHFSSLFATADNASPIAVFAAAVLIATGIVPGVLAERARFWPAMATSALLAAIIIPIAALWATGGGWLAKMGFSDPGGAGWLHLPGALCAAVGASFVGPRTGKFNRDGSSTAIPGHSLPLAGIGVVFLLVGFFIFLGIQSPAAAMNVLLAAAAGGLASVMFSQLRYFKPDIHLTCAGIVGAMVAISAGASSVPALGAVLIGAVAGVIVPLAILTIDIKIRIDDPSAGLSIHGVGALWGLLAAPLLSRSLTMGERFKHLGAHLIGIVAISALTLALSTALWMLLKRTTKLRVSESDEFDGLDLAEHDIGAYPDFQQNTIKSYHLREM